ncbi:MAG TPA: hypothetical protein DCZ76_02580 [Treponema sp.]|nr:hypothetical protein [Treponema sp.]
MEAGAGTLESGINCLPWHFIPQVFWRKLARFFCKQKTRPPWRCLFYRIKCRGSGRTRSAGHSLKTKYAPEEWQIVDLG